jgi:hypothetical protein
MSLLKDVEKKMFVFDNKKYFINIDVLKQVCFPKQDEGIKQADITEEYETPENGDSDSFSMVSKVVHETKTTGNIGTPIDTSLFEMVKIMILSLVDITSTEKFFSKDFGTVLSINTLLACGILEIIE